MQTIGATNGSNAEPPIGISCIAAITHMGCARGGTHGGLAVVVRLLSEWTPAPVPELGGYGLPGGVRQLVRVLLAQAKSNSDVLHAQSPQARGSRRANYLLRERAGHQDEPPYCDFAVPFALDTGS
jgi:hypothetical protein